MSEIHYFPRYSQQENFVTNNTLLLLNRIYQFDRFKFQKLLSSLDSDCEMNDIAVGLQFAQQRSYRDSVVDGYLFQQSLKIGIETKLGDGFGLDQLKRHANGLQSADCNILIMLSPSENVSSVPVTLFRNELSIKGINLICTSFERMIASARVIFSDFDVEMHLLLDDFAGFCSDFGLLPSDEYTMLVPPCRQSYELNVHQRLYYCPVGRISRKPKYLGIYAWKSVRKLGLITKRVEITVGPDRSVESAVPSISLSEEEKTRILNAYDEAMKRGWDLASGTEIFLCDELFDTDYVKDTPGGIQGFQYHDLRDVTGQKNLPDLRNLAEILRNAKWKGRSSI